MSYVVPEWARRFSRPAPSVARPPHRSSEIPRQNHKRVIGKDFGSWTDFTPRSLWCVEGHWPAPDGGESHQDSHQGWIGTAGLLAGLGQCSTSGSPLNFTTAYMKPALSQLQGSDSRAGRRPKMRGPCVSWIMNPYGISTTRTRQAARGSRSPGHTVHWRRAVGRRHRTVAQTVCCPSQVLLDPIGNGSHGG